MLKLIFNRFHLTVKLLMLLKQPALQITIVKLDIIIVIKFLGVSQFL